MISHLTYEITLYINIYMVIFCSYFLISCKDAIRFYLMHILRLWLFWEFHVHILNSGYIQNAFSRIVISLIILTETWAGSQGYRNASTDVFGSWEDAQQIKSMLVLFACVCMLVYPYPLKFHLFCEQLL